MICLGTVKPGSTVRIPFSSFDKDDGSSITMTNYAVADILVYKDGNTTERASTTGYTATTDFDAKTGKHLAIIDLSSDATAGFFQAGSEYLVAIDAVTVDAVTTGGWIGCFKIGYPGAVLDTTIATLATQTSFTLTAGPAEDDALNGSVVIIHDLASAVQHGYGYVLDYTGASKTVTLTAGTTFTAAVGDNVSVMPRTDLSYILGSLVSTSTAQLGVNVVNAAGTAWGSGAITAASIATDAIGAAELAADAVAEIADAVWDEATSGHRTLGTYGQAFTTLSGEVNGVATTSSIPFDGFTEATADHWIGGILVFTSGALLGQARAIVASTSTTLTVKPNLTEAPADNDDFVIIPAHDLKDSTNGRFQSYVFEVGNDAITANSIASAAIDADSIAPGAITAAKMGSGFYQGISDEIWDEARSSHVVAGTFGSAVQAQFMGAVSSATSSTLVLGTQAIGSAASGTDDFYNGLIVCVVAGTGEGQQRTIVDYVGASKTITPDGNWTTTPDATSKVIIIGV